MYDKMSVISQKGESQNGCCKKKKHAKFSEKRNVHFSENLACFVFLKYPFWDSPFCLITDEKILRFYNITRKVSQKMRFTRRNLNSIEILKSLQCQGRSCWNSSKYINWIGKFSNYFCVKWFQRLTFNTWRFSDVFIGNFEENSRIVLVFP